MRTSKSQEIHGFGHRLTYETDVSERLGLQVPEIQALGSQ